MVDLVHPSIPITKTTNRVKHRRTQSIYINRTAAADGEKPREEEVGKVLNGTEGENPRRQEEPVGLTLTCRALRVGRRRHRLSRLTDTVKENRVNVVVRGNLDADSSERSSYSVEETTRDSTRD